MPAADSRTLRIDLELRGNLAKFFPMKDREIILDGPAGTGKTRVLLERQDAILHKYPRARGLMVRKFRSSMNETCLDVFRNEIIRDADGNLYPDAPQWKERDQKFIYPNGSEFIVAGMDDPGKVMSSKYDFFYWNETIEAKRAEWEAIMSRLRNFKVPYQQALGDTNPGPPTHWIKQYGDAGKLRLLQTTHKDNPVYWDAKRGKWTAKGEAYVNGILRDSLSGLRYKRLYEGKWVLAEGQVYDSFSPEVHVVQRRTFPAHWYTYWAFDFGFIDPLVWQEWKEDPETGELWLNRELYHSELRVEEACQIIKQAGWLVPPMALICDHDAENRATLEKEFGMLTLPAYKAIHPGIEAVKKRLLPNRTYGRPTIFITENCGIAADRKLLERHKPTSTQEEFDCYVWDTAKMSADKYKDMPVDKDNHGMDAMRYMVAFIDNVAEDPHEFQHVVSARDMFEDEDMLHAMQTMISPF